MFDDGRERASNRRKHRINCFFPFDKREREREREREKERERF